MKEGLSGAQPHKREQRRLLGITRIMAGVAALTAFHLLAGCASLTGGAGTRTTSTPAVTVEAMATATATQKASPWKLVWSDEFNGPAGTPPNPSNWTPEIGGEGWGNQELSYNTNNLNAYQDGSGNLVLEARKGNPAGYQCWYGPCQYTSARISTKGHFSFTYGRLEARIKIPYGQGLWSAFWLLGANCATVGWPDCGEVDVMENIGREPGIIYGTVHGPEYASGTYKLQHGAFADDFHVYALQWDPSHLYFFVDGINYFTLDKTAFKNQRDWAYDHPFNILLEVPVGGTWPGSPDSTTAFPQKLLVSYMRLYQE